MEPFIDDRIQILIDRLDTAAEKEEEIDLKKWTVFFVMDVLGELACSGSFGVLEGGDSKLMPPIREHVSSSF